MRISIGIAPFLLTALAACTAGPTGPAELPGDVRAYASNAPSSAPPAEPASAIAAAVLRNASGEQIGMAQFTEDAYGRVHVNVHVRGVTPGLHGLHLHAVGACDGSTTSPFTSAGGHFNPTGRQHGHHNPAGHHSGDLPNLVANEAGIGRLSVSVQQFALADLFDADGTALVLHQDEDDLRTDSGPRGPGNSGARIACAVVDRP